MADYTQGDVLTLLAHSEITHPGNLVGAAIACPGWLEAEISAWIANIETTANAVGAVLVVQSSIDDAGNNWQDVLRVSCSTTAAESEALTSATEAIGATVLELASTTNLTVGDLIYIKAAAGVANSEWCEIAKVVTNTSIEIVDGLEVAKASGDLVYDQAQRFSVRIPLAGLRRLRALVIHQSGTGSDLRVEVTARAATAFE
jgi:hypothetical protein